MSEIELKSNIIKAGREKGIILRFILASLVGVFMFFVPVTINGASSIMIDHIVSWIRASVPDVVPYYALFVMAIGAIYPFYTKKWNASIVDICFSILKVVGVVFGILYCLKVGPAWFFAPDVGPFLYEKLVISVSLLVPIGSAFLALLVGYGLLEFIGTFCRPIMRPLWNTPGRSAIDAVASFVGSYSLALLITNRVYKEGKYTTKEAAIIATGFSTVSATFMIIIAKTLDIMHLWNVYFWTTLVVTFIVTAITVRIPPLSRKPDTYVTEEGFPEPVYKEKMLECAWEDALEVSKSAPSIMKNIAVNLKDGFIMTMGILPSIMSVGLIGIVLAKFTPIFDWISYIFYPFTWLLQLPEADLAAKAASVGIAEMFLPSLLVVSAPLVTKFVIAVVSVSSILFFSASIPCILSTDIPLKASELIILYVQRTILTLLIITPIAYLLL
ncbi:YjiH family protein [Bacillus thuringiensis]|uniref:Histidine transporter n=1 Tax=Bacillus thuringiensis TaxID=1428 RepID=A0A9X6V5R3_BACTU|nr:YjiH family protein [Bacillus thuringiensis]MCU5280488.1 YjiH family protein [Bacillus cereus]AMR85543.1 histidine transporter [Bacillus thuringiensis]KIP26440.1 nucleoside recognition family protein [Bacillus thuringiensis serovar morrisoni]MBG9636007.1 histidine transporter [Bacillus thuringiensis]MBG9673328.1 histidine transporter [Bacillus thuringiensis]